MKISEYLKDPQDKQSSKRLMSYQLLWFFMLFNIIMFPLMIGLSVDINIIILILGFDFMVLIAIFTPTQLSKIQEVKTIIESIKTK